MRDLKVTGIDGTDLQLVDQDGGHYRLLVDDRVRKTVADTASTDVTTNAATGACDPQTGDSTATPSAEQTSAPVLAAVPPPSPGVPPSPDMPALPPGELVTPRTVQELLRAGHSVEQVAAAASWELSKVERYAVPIEAERNHIAGLARDLPVAASSGDAAATVGQRVVGRLHDRGVTAESVAWDAYRTAGSGWIVVCRFSAGGRGREASWQFRTATRTLTAIDDEARWLGEDERTSGGPIPTSSTPARPVKPVKVFDVEAEGGVTEPVDLVSAMQARSRDRRSRGARSTRAARGPSSSGPVGAGGTEVDATSAVPDAASPGQLVLPAQQPGHTRHEEDRADRPTVEELGHDPVTGTVDLFTETKLSPDDADVSGAGPVVQQDSKDPTDELPAAHDKVASDGDTPDDEAEVQGPEIDVEDTEVQGAASSMPTGDAAVTDEAPGDQGPDQAPAVEQTQTSPVPPRRQSSSRSGRPAVPSWDDIMFGGRRGRD
ncbi:MAG: septation protein SepH [Allobranchiibius sp.]